MTQILFTKRLAGAKTPTRATKHAAAFDLYAADISRNDVTGQLIIDTGLNIAFPEGYVLLLFSRSGHAMKHSIRLANCVGVIDADYRGPLKVLLKSDHPGDTADADEFDNAGITQGDRIAQAILMPVPHQVWIQAESLPESIRGEGGFGSTGTN